MEKDGRKTTRVNNNIKAMQEKSILDKYFTTSLNMHVKFDLHRLQNTMSTVSTKTAHKLLAAGNVKK